MKSSERTKKIRDMSVDELQRYDAEISEQMFKLRFQWAMGRTESLKKMREIRKDRARVQTVMRERQNEN